MESPRSEREFLIMFSPAWTPTSMALPPIDQTWLVILSLVVAAEHRESVRSLTRRHLRRFLPASPTGTRRETLRSDPDSSIRICQPLRLSRYGKSTVCSSGRKHSTSSTTSILPIRMSRSPVLPLEGSAPSTQTIHRELYNLRLSSTSRPTAP